MGNMLAVPAGTLLDLVHVLGGNHSVTVAAALQKLFLHCYIILKNFIYG